MSYDSSEEFQDAVDTLTPLPLTTRPNDFGIGTPRTPINSGDFIFVIYSLLCFFFRCNNTVFKNGYKSSIKSKKSFGCFKKSNAIRIWYKWHRNWWWKSWYR